MRAVAATNPKLESVMGTPTIYQNFTEYENQETKWTENYTIFIQRKKQRRFLDELGNNADSSYIQNISKSTWRFESLQNMQGQFPSQTFERSSSLLVNMKSNLQVIQQS